MTISQTRREWVDYVKYLVHKREIATSHLKIFGYHEWRDVEQNILIHIWNNKWRFRKSRGHIKSWIKTITFNYVHNTIRDKISAIRLNRRGFEFKTINDGKIVYDFIDPTTTISPRTLEDLKEKLDDKEMYCVELALAGLSRQQIARKIRLKRPTTYQIFRRIRKKFLET